jgi:hypothetical protein
MKVGRGNRAKAAENATPPRSDAFVEIASGGDTGGTELAVSRYVSRYRREPHGSLRERTGQEPDRQLHEHLDLCIQDIVLRRL